MKAMSKGATKNTKVDRYIYVVIYVSTRTSSTEEGGINASRLNINFPFGIFFVKEMSQWNISGVHVCLDTCHFGNEFNPFCDRLR